MKLTLYVALLVCASPVMAQHAPNHQNTAARIKSKSVPGDAAVFLPAAEAAKYVGKVITVSAKVYGYKPMSNRVLLSMDAPAPQQPLTVILKGSAQTLAAGLNGQTIAVTGRVSRYQGKPAIEITEDKDLIVVRIVGKAGTKGG